MHNLVELPSLQKSQHVHMFHMEPNILFHGNIIDFRPAIPQNTGKININSTVLM